jgi:hypothetical protein
MNLHRNRWLLLALILVAASAWFGVYWKRVASVPRVTASLLSYTNGANGLRFLMISFVNRERVPIQWHDVWVEEEGSSEHHAPTMNPNLPWITKATLESGDSEVLAVGSQEHDLRWRVCRAYSPVGSTKNYTATSKWFEPQKERQ